MFKIEFAFGRPIVKPTETESPVNLGDFCIFKMGPYLSLHYCLGIDFQKAITVATVLSLRVRTRKSSVFWSAVGILLCNLTLFIPPLSKAVNQKLKGRTDFQIM